MTTTTDQLLDASPAAMMRQVRGVVERSTPTYGETLQLEVRDPDGLLWRFMAWDAEWAPHDAGLFPGKTVRTIDLQPSGRMVWRFSGGVTLTIDPRVPPEDEDDPPYWELHAPDGLFLVFGPGAVWRVQSASAA